MIDNQNELQKKCESLPYSGTGYLNDEVYADTTTEIQNLYSVYGYARVIGTLAKIWSFEKMVRFFEKSVIPGTKDRQIKTIATSYFRAYNGGLERVNAELMDLWVRMGYKVVFFSEEPENSLDYTYPVSVKRITVPSYAHISERLEALQKYCIEEHVDLFINHKWTENRSIWDRVLMNCLDIPCVQYCHGHFSFCFVNGRPALYQPRAFRLSDLVVALSETNARFYQLCGCRTYLVQNPVPEKLLANSSPSELDSDRVLMVGRLSYEKYPMEALDIFRMVLEKRPGTVLDIVGDGSDETLGVMKRFISDYHMEDAVVFHGLKNDAELWDYYKSAACVLFTSKMEGYPMIVLEAKAYGVPLVMYDMPFLSLLKDGKGVLTAQAGDTHTMADNLMSVMEDKELRKKLGAEGRESFETFAGYDLENAWREIIAICSGKTVRSEAFFEPEALSVADRNIIPVLLDKIDEGYYNTFTQSSDFRLGSALLRFPRKVRKRLKK